MEAQLAHAINQFFVVTDLLRHLLDQQRFCMSNSSNAKGEGKGVDEAGLDGHGG